MIGLDTNLLLRFLVRDDVVQTRRAAKAIEKNCGPDEPGFVNRIVLCELAWVLVGGYGYGHKEVAAVMEGLLESGDIALEDSVSVRAAVRAYRSGNADFADCLIGQVNRARGCETTLTFDRKAARLVEFALAP